MAEDVVQVSIDKCFRVGDQKNIPEREFDPNDLRVHDGRIVVELSELLEETKAAEHEILGKQIVTALERGGVEGYHFSYKWYLPEHSVRSFRLARYLCTRYGREGSSHVEVNKFRRRIDREKVVKDLILEYGVEYNLMGPGGRAQGVPKNSVEGNLEGVGIPFYRLSRSSHVLYFSSKVADAIEHAFTFCRPGTGAITTPKHKQEFVENYTDALSSK